MFSDMDDNLREIGVSDLSVGKRMRAMWEAFHGRAKVYASAIEAADRAALEAALARNVWRGAPPDGAAASLRRVVLAQTRPSGRAAACGAGIGSGAVSAGGGGCDDESGTAPPDCHRARRTRGT